MKRFSSQPRNVRLGHTNFATDEHYGLFRNSASDEGKNFNNCAKKQAIKKNFELAY